MNNDYEDAKAPFPLGIRKLKEGMERVCVCVCLCVCVENTHLELSGTLVETMVNWKI